MGEKYQNSNKLILEFYGMLFEVKMWFETVKNLIRTSSDYMGAFQKILKSLLYEENIPTCRDVGLLAPKQNYYNKIENKYSGVNKVYI